MKITVELEHKEEINTPMLFADAVERFFDDTRTMSKTSWKWLNI